jgi:hypothetical protein
VLVAVLVYTPPSGGAGARRGEIVQALRRAVAATGAQVAEGAIDRARGAIGSERPERLAFFGAAIRALRTAREHVERVELAEAEESLRALDRLYEPELHRPGVPQLWSEAALLGGIVAFERGQRDEARRLFRRAVALEPTTTLTEATVRPDVARAFAEATKPRRKVELRIETDTPAQLTVDGQPPTGEVMPGEHVVIARAEGRVPAALLVEVKDALTVQLSLPREPQLAALDSLSAAPTRAGLGALVDLGGVDEVLVVAAGVDAGELALVGERFAECATPTATVALRGTAVDVGAAALLERLRAKAKECGGEPAAPLEAPAVAHPRPLVAVEKKVPPPPKKKKWWERPWIWVGALAVTTAAVALGAGLAPSTTNYRVSVDGAAFSR